MSKIKIRKVANDVVPWEVRLPNGTYHDKTMFNDTWGRDLTGTYCFATWTGAVAFANSIPAIYEFRPRGR